MFKQLVAGTALSIALSATAAHAQRAHFAYTGKIVTYKVRTTGLYLIIAYGAQGGNDVLPGGTEGSGGLGAEIGGDFTLTAGTELQIAVGGKGGDARFSGGGGGGGSFVVGPDNEPLIIAGGGGGGGNTYADVPLPGHGGLTTQNATAPLGGTNGNGGKGLVGFDGGGGGGGGFYSAGADASPGGRGGGGWPGLMGGAQGGGYGGGGGTGGNICCAAGGGGGVVTVAVVAAGLHQADAPKVEGAAASTLAQTRP